MYNMYTYKVILQVVERRTATGWWRPLPPPWEEMEMEICAQDMNEATETAQAALNLDGLDGGILDWL